MDTSNPKWKDVQKFDNWTHDLERYLKVKKIDIRGSEVLEALTMYLKGPAKTLINKYLREAAMGEYHAFILILREHTIPSTNKDSLWKTWENISLFRDGASKGVHTYARELDELQTKLTDKDGEQIITEQGKIKKFINSIPAEVQAKVKGETNEDMTFE